MSSIPREYELIKWRLLNAMLVALNAYMQWQPSLLKLSCILVHSNTQEHLTYWLWCHAESVLVMLDHSMIHVDCKILGCEYRAQHRVCMLVLDMDRVGISRKWDNCFALNLWMGVSGWTLVLALVHWRHEMLDCVLRHISQFSALKWNMTPVTPWLWSTLVNNRNHISHHHSERFHQGSCFTWCVQVMSERAYLWVERSKYQWEAPLWWKSSF